MTTLVMQSKALSQETRARAADTRIRIAGARRLLNPVWGLSGASDSAPPFTRLAAIVESSDDAIVTKTLEGVVTSWNPGAERIFGYTAAEMIGRPITTIIPASLAHEESEFLRRLGRGEHIDHYETTRLRKDGHAIDISVTLSPLHDATGAIVGISKIARDITEQKRAAALVRAQSETWRVTLSSIGDGVIATDAEGRITFMNAVAETLTGWSAADARSQPLATVFRIVNEQTRRPAEDPVTRVLRDGMTVGLANHTILKARDGHERPIDDSAAPIFDEGSQIIGVVLVFRDGTERRRADAALRESQQRFQAMADAAPVMIWMSGTDKLCTWFNKTWLTFVNRSMEQELGNGWADNVHLDDFDACLATYTTAFDARQSFSMDYRLKRHDGEYRWVLDSGIPLYGPDGVFTGYIGSCIDITERKQAEQTLRATEARLAAEATVLSRLNELSSRLWRMTSLQAGLEEMLEATIELLGADKGNIQMLDAGRGVLHIAAHRGFEQGFLDAFREVSAEDDAACGRALRSGQRVVIEDVETDALFAPFRSIARAAGYRSVQSTPLIGRDGAVLGMLSTHWRSIHRPGEQDWQGLDLYMRQAADFIERCRMDEALREADRRKDEFLATLAHELRNPLAPIRNAVQILRLEESPSPELKYTREVLDRQTQQMSRLLDDLMDVSRIVRNRIDLHTERVDVASVLQAAVETSRPVIDGPGHAFSFILPLERIHVDADATRLTQVFANLLNNAATYSEPKGRISLSAQRDGNEVVIAVRDHGMGIPKEMLPRIFDLFTQVDRSLGRSHSGLGIGLTLVKRLVELHGGHVTAHSEGAGTGAEFIVRLPVSSGPMTPGSRAMSTSEGTEESVPRRVLVVDDNRDAATSLELMLRMLGHETRAAFDGSTGLEVAAEFRPDVVFLDIGMAKMNGYEVARRLREQPWGNQIVLIAVTGWGQAEDKRRTAEAGFDHHVVKPADPHVLTSLLASLARKA